MAGDGEDESGPVRPTPEMLAARRTAAAELAETRARAGIKVARMIEHLDGIDSLAKLIAAVENE